MIVLPMLMILMYAFTQKGNDVLTFRFTIENFLKFFSDPNLFGCTETFLVGCVGDNCAVSAVGYPIAYIISQTSGRKKILLVMLITIPMWINMLVRTYAWVGILQDKGLINTLWGYIGIGPLPLIYTDFAVVLGMVYNFIPFMILQIYTSLSKMDKSYLEARQ